MRWRLRIGAVERLALAPVYFWTAKIISARIPRMRGNAVVIPVNIQLEFILPGRIGGLGLWGSHRATIVIQMLVLVQFMPLVIGSRRIGWVPENAVGISTNARTNLVLPVFGRRSGASMQG